MNYNETLLRFVKDSKLTLREIAKLCKEEHNVKINPSYISKLTSEDHAPASEEVNEAIALVTGNDPEELYFAAYLSKAPASVINLIDRIVKYMKDFTSILLKNQLKKEMAPMVEQAMEKISDWDIIKKVLESEPDLPNDKNMVFVRSQEPELRDIMALIDSNTGIPMPDNSMEPLIPEGAIVQFDYKNEVEDNNIVVAYQISTKVMYIRRYVKNGTKGLLIADNTKFKPIHVGGDSDVKVACRVKSFVREL